jgi:hypothetical protein
VHSGRCEGIIEGSYMDSYMEVIWSRWEESEERKEEERRSEYPLGWQEGGPTLK